MDTVVYLLVDVVGTAGKYDYLAVFSTGLADDVLGLVGNVGMIALQSLIGGINCGGDASLILYFSVPHP